MSVDRFNRHFGNKRGSAQKALDSMIAQYGEEKGRRVFYATMQSRRKDRERGTGLRKATADRKKKRGRFKSKEKEPGLRGAVAERRKR